MESSLSDIVMPLVFKFVLLPILALILIRMTLSAFRDQKTRSLLEGAISSFPKYKNMPAVLGTTLCLAIHTNERRVLIVAKGRLPTEVPFESFLCAQVFEDGVARFDARRSVVPGRAVIGGLIGRSALPSVVRRISVIALTTDAHFPILEWTIFSPILAPSKVQPIEVFTARKQALSFLEDFRPIFSG
jgi:hypothetical protein